MFLRGILGVVLLWQLSTKAAEVQFQFKDGSCQATRRWDGKYRGNFASTNKGWKLDYTFPKLTYGFAERAVEQKIRFPMPASMKNAKTISLSLYNETDTGHAFMVRLTGKDGTEWNSPPVILNGEKNWRDLSFSLSDFRNFRKGGAPVPQGNISYVTLVVQQAITSRMATLGAARRGLVCFKNFQVSDQSSPNKKPMFFDGKIFVPEALSPMDSGRIALRLSRSGKSKAYPVRGGIPFARGMIRELKNLRLLENGKEIPAGLEVLSRYADGSIRVVRVTAAADLTGKKQYALEYGTKITRMENRQKSGSEKSGTLVVDTGLLRAEFTESGDCLLNTLQLRGKTVIEELSASFDSKTALKDKKVELETNNGVESVVRVSGNFVDGGYGFCARFVFVRGSLGIRSDFTFFNRDGKEIAPVFPDVKLTGRWGTRASRWNFGEPVPFEADTLVTLFQDGAVYKDDTRTIQSMLSAGGKMLKTIDRFNGIWSVETSAGTVGCAIADAWMNNPKSVELSADFFRIGLSSPESVYTTGKNPRSVFFKGMAKTHRMILSFDAPEMGSDFVMQPLLTASPDYLCASGVFGKITPVDTRNFPVFEEVARNWTGTRFEINRYFGDMYNLRDFGDYGGVRAGATWMNLETGVGMAFLIQFIRSGDPEMLDNAIRSNLHYINIDTCHADVDPKHPGRTIGAVSAHRPEHVASPKNLKKHDLAHLGINGHDWYPEVAFSYLLTGEEIFQDASLLHADATVRAIEKEFNPGHVLAREYAWPVKNLMAFHMVNPDPRYVRAAAKVMNFFAFWRNAFGSGRLGNTLGQPGVCLEAIAYYYRETGDPQAAELLKTATHFLVRGTYISPEDGLPSDSLYNEDSRMMFLNGLSEYYRLTGDRKMVERFIPYLYFHIRHPEPLCDSTIPWCAPEFIRIMGELQLKEPVRKTSIPVWNTSFTKPNKKGEFESELRFCQTVDEPFSITVSRIAAMRLGRFTRGLVIGDWQGYPDNAKNELKTSEPELSRKDYGSIIVLAPDGKEILRDSFHSYVSNIRTFRIPADGKTGIYRIFLRTADRINLTFEISISRPGLALVSKDSLPWLQTVYIPVVSQHANFSATVSQRRPNAPGGGRMTSPQGKRTELFNNPNLDFNPEAVFSGRGRGVWMLERSMLSTISHLTIQGTEALLCPTREDAQMFIHYGKVK